MTVDAGQQVLHYLLLEKLGEGGMGEVWKAHDSVLDRDVAIKFLSEAFLLDADRLARFQREAKLLAAIDHPNIVTIHALERDNSRAFIIMELVKGGTLEDLIVPGGLPVSQLTRIALALCDALSAAHERGITHGDLKPRNVMLTTEGHVKVVDFGLARRPRVAVAAESHRTTQPLESPGSVSGTLPYLSPEQLQGQQADSRSDIFSLGVLLHEMALGRRPFAGSTASEVIASILRDKPPSLSGPRPDLPRHVDRLVGRCLEKDPARRLQTAAELRHELAAMDRQSAGYDPDAPPSVAVLPFADMSPQKDQDYFCEGIADEIINALTRVPNLRVVSRTSSFQFKNKTLDIREIGDRLGAGTLLEGSVRKAGSQIRVTAELVNVADGFPIWSAKYDRALKDVFAIQDEIAQAIVEALKLSLSPRVRRAIKQVSTTDVEAYEYYLRGRMFFHQYGRRGITFALQMFRSAIEKDPGYALAHAGVADCCSYLYMNAEHVEANRENAEKASRDALALDPDLAEAHISRGVALSLSGRDTEAVDAFETAVRLSPRLFEAHYFYARHCFSHGQQKKAIRLYEEAARLNPEDYQALLLVPQIYEDLGRPEEAVRARRVGIERAARRLDLNPDDVRALYMGANGLVNLGEHERGLEWSRRARQLEPDDPMVLYNLACNYALAGIRDEAISCLEVALANGFAFRGWLEHDSNLDSLRGQSRFQTLVERLPPSGT